MSFPRLWGAVSYLGALILGVYIVARRMEKRQHFPLRAVLCIIAISMYKAAFDTVLGLITVPDPLRLLLRTLDSFTLYSLSLAAVGVCYVCDIWAMLFCATAGYCMEHMCQRTYSIIATLFLPGVNPYLGAALQTAITVLGFVLLYKTMIQKAEYRGTMLNSRVQVSVSFIAVLVTIFLNSYALREATGLQTLQIYIMVFSVLCAVLVFYVEFGWLAAKKAEIDRNMIQQIAEADRQHYLVEKDIIDLMNIKLHDLRRLLDDLGAGMSPDELASLQQTVNLYDSIFKTGNRALDITLTRKSLLCEKKGITLTCSIDGGKLGFLSDSEIYSLFSNLLDNAIEAVDRIETPGRRVISVTSYETASALIIHEENFTEEIPVFEDGLPQTTKEDTQYHGFGTKSIRMVCDRYHGECHMSATDGVFEVDIIFPHVQPDEQHN